jgi:hypothetical protein
VRTHVLISKDKGLSRESLLEAISQGHCYISFDLFSDPKGFKFQVESSDKIMGDEIARTGGLTLKAGAPIAGRFVLLRNGLVVDHKAGTTADFPVDSAGSYRLEVYLDSLPAPAKGQPWILSNPIYVVEPVAFLKDRSPGLSAKTPIK